MIFSLHPNTSGIHFSEYKNSSGMFFLLISTALPFTEKFSGNCFDGVDEEMCMVRNTLRIICHLEVKLHKPHWLPIPVK